MLLFLLTMKGIIAALWGFTAVTAFGQSPLIYSRAVVNAASFMPQALPGGGIARGSLFSIFGTRFGPSAPAQASAFPLDIALSNVSVTITQGGTTANAIPVFVSASQINAIMPSNAPLGMASLRVSYSNARSNPVPVRIVENTFGIFTATGAGVGPGILQNYIAPENQPINSPTITAQPGQTIVLWGTGLGAVPADNVAPAAGNLPTKVEVFVGGKPAAVTYSGRTPCCSGTDQVVFVVPADAPTGCWVPVYVRTGGTTVSNFVTMGIQTDGSGCADSQNPISAALIKGGKLGGFAAVRATTREDIGVKAPVDVTADYQGAFAFEVPAGGFPFNPAGSIPPPGTCTAYSVRGDLLAGNTVPGTLPTGRVLDVGPMFSLTGPRGSKMVSPYISGTLIGYLGGLVSGGLVQNTLFLEPGAYSVTGTGGLDVGRFTANFTIPQPLTWTNRDQLQTVDRAQPLTLTWTGGAADQQLAIVGVGEDLPTNASTAFLCAAPPGSNSFTVPAVILSNLPATRANVLKSKSVLYLVAISTSNFTPVDVSGLDTAAAVYSYIAGKTVVFR